ncbi:RagB/SusD family nutrient uptake outer membrane protein [Flavihumibacter sp. ZG627]|uniref:RagB/SusD family nutrient uptake outer membrane protein n=1 Tax=Flavihumibacter sp. ZG627 TaxID=1463156 RepID=UPI00057EDD2E|nr:RagB/SusD family nutrient uptake outer membrane protein [Flavihumibacter sp. ZG627]KIC90103.1 starch-binding protein [Flavihumibacter sp. ZG627]
MKHIIIFFSCFTLMVAGCKKMDLEPEATASRSAVFGSEKGLQLYTASFYNNLPNGGDIVRADNMSDYGARTDVPSFLTESGFTALQGSGWNWTALRNINYFIENNNDPAVPENIRTNYTATARFFRALFYFDKVVRFGNVPWYGKTIAVNDSAALKKPRDARSLVMDSVLADITYAAENITTTDATRSMITRYVALAYKSRICLFEGTFRKYHSADGGLAAGLGATASTWLQEAVDASKQLIEEGGFSLNTAGGTDLAYRQIFISKQPVRNEIILSNIADATLNVLNDANWYWTSATYGSRLSFTRGFVHTYLKIDGTPYTATPGYETAVFADEVKNRDKRLQQTIRMGNYKRINGGASEPAPPVFSYTYTGYQPIKWTLDDMFFDGGTRNDNSISLIRYAEVLLNYAEAKAELGTITDEDWAATVGALRARAGITGTLTSLPTIVDPYLQQEYFPSISDPVLLEIRRERGIELAWEGLRFQDLIRWKRGELLTKPWNGFYVPELNVAMDLNEDGKNDVLFYNGTAPAPMAGVTFVNVSPKLGNGSNNPQRLSNDSFGEINWLNNISRKWDDKKYLYPIPTADLLINPALGQNPGWD